METQKIEIEGETIYIKKGKLGWGIVYPYKIDGKINWKSLISGGAWWKLGLVIFYVGISIGAMFEVRHLVEIASQCISQTITI